MLNKIQNNNHTISESKVGIVFSSGFFGFFAHAGFLAALREMEISVSAYAGSSSGAIVAAMAASGMDDRSIKDMLFSLKKDDFWDPDPWYLVFFKALGLLRGYTGYLKGNKFADLLKIIPKKQIQECETPLAITATNLNKKEETVFSKGDLIKAVQASGAVPILFKPVEINGSLYVDGGTTTKAPLRALADLVNLDKIILHFIASGNLEEEENSYLKSKMTPWNIQHLAFNIARKEAYQQQLWIMKMRGIEVVEVKTDAPAVNPNKLDQGPIAYEKARVATLEILKNLACQSD